MLLILYAKVAPSSAVQNDIILFAARGIPSPPLQSHEGSAHAEEKFRSDGINISGPRAAKFQTRTDNVSLARVNRSTNASSVPRR